MDKDKQIEEMFFDVVKAFNYARDFCADQGGCDICKNRKHGKNCDFMTMGEHLYTAGYRKASEVAREIFEAFRDEMRSEIARNEELFAFAEDDNDFYEGRNDAFRTAINCLAELKKKYTEGGECGANN